MEKKLNYYFVLCIRQAYETENRNYDADMQAGRIKKYFIVVGNQLIFNIKTPYARVTRIAIMRIERNIKKNFGLTTKGDYFLENKLDVNYSTNKLLIDDKEFYLGKGFDYSTMNQGKVFVCGKYEKLCLAYHEITIDELKKNPDIYHISNKAISWDKFVEIYKKVYDVPPMVTISIKSMNVKIADT